MKQSVLKKSVLAGVIALSAMALSTSSAHAAPAPQTMICAGAAQSDGSFVTQEVNTGPLPGIGLGLSQDLCVVLNGAGFGDAVTGLVEDLGEAEPPSEPPSPEQIEAILEDLQELDPSNPLAALLFVSNTCANLNATSLCNAIIGAVLNNAVIPLGSVELQGESGSCFSQQQSGVGDVQGGNAGGRFDLEWTADYEAGGNALGVISGTAVNTSFDDSAGQVSPITGVIGPGCGAGGKLLILQIG